MSGAAAYAVAVGAAVIVLAVVIVVDKRRPLRLLDDHPDPPADVPGAYLGDGDLDRMTNERIAAETRLHRRHT